MSDLEFELDLDQDEDLDFDAWCPVCERAIPIPSTSTAPPPSSHSSSSKLQAPSTSPTNSNFSGKGKRATSVTRTVSGKKEGAGKVPRRKSTTKLHRASHGAANVRRPSHTTMTASTPLHPVGVGAEEEEEEEVERTLKMPTSLYCSEDCRRIDEMRSRLAFAHLGPAPNSHGLGIGGSALSTSRDGRRLSQASATSSGASEGMHRQRSAGAAPSGSNGSAYGAESSSSLDFSARRNSKGSIGDFGGGLRMTRGYSDDEVLGGKRWSGSGGSGGRRGSGDSLASQMHDADERSERGYSANRPPSALSAFRLMTPISDRPPSPRRPSISQHHTTSYQGDMRSPHMPTERSVSAGEIRKLAATGETIVPEKAWKGHRNDGPMLPPEVPIVSRKPRRTDSSSSLALMGTSLGKSYGRSVDTKWSQPVQPYRSASTASLSGLVAQGTILPSSTVSSAVSSPALPPGHSSPYYRSPPPPPRAKLSTASIPRLSNSPGSHSETSNSSFPSSHYSTHSQRSTASSSDLPEGGQYGTYNARPPVSPSRRQARESQRSSSVEPRRSSRGSSVDTGGTRRRKMTMMPNESSFLKGQGLGLEVEPGSWKDEKTPTQSLSKATSLYAAGVSRGSSMVNLASHGSMSSEAVKEKRVSFSYGIDADDVGRRRKDARAMSTPGNARRPTPLDLSAPSYHHHNGRLHPSASARLLAHPPSATSMNPALSYLYPDSPGVTAKNKNWSWDNLAVPTYEALDVERFRREKSGVNLAGLVDGVVKERKKLFYFSDAGE